MGTVAHLLDDACARGAFPGAVLYVWRDGAVRYHHAHGRRATDLAGSAAEERARFSPVSPDTLYDLASLTKVIATTSLVLRLLDRALLRLEMRVDELISGFAPVSRGRVTLAHLLRHTSGLPWWRPLYETVGPLALAGMWVESRAGMLAAVTSTPLERPPGAAHEYSDLGFILAGVLCERAAGRASLDRLFDDEIARPLGLRDIGYIDNTRTPSAGPLHLGGEAVSRERIAPTERCPWRGEILWAKVHDENAYALGGVAGHAGLFGTAEAVGRFAVALLGCASGQPGPFSRDLVERFWSRDAECLGSHVLGWDTPTPGASQSGTRLSARAVGHTGFTGTSLWIDPARDLVVVLLTNRVHPSRNDERIRTLRPELHDRVVEATGG